jgi:hypothetical protein
MKARIDYYGEEPKMVGLLSGAPRDILLNQIIQFLLEEKAVEKVYVYSTNSLANITPRPEVQCIQYLIDAPIELTHIPVLGEVVFVDMTHGSPDILLEYLIGLSDTSTFRVVLVIPNEPLDQKVFLKKLGDIISRCQLPTGATFN